jgi:hypothetical protein
MPKKFVFVSVLLLCILGMGFAPLSQAQLDESKLTWKPNRGISLNGATDYIEVAGGTYLDVDQITVEAWVYFRDTSDRQQIIGRGAAGAYFTLYADNGNMRFLIENADVGNESARAPMPPANTWVHIAGSYDGSMVRLYYNGILMQETEFPDAVLRYGEDPLFIGALVPGERHVNGLIENVRIWNQALTVEELDVILATQPENEDPTWLQSHGLIGYWAQRSVDGDSVQDFTGNSDGTMKKFKLDQSQLTFMPEGGVSFDGQSTYIKIEDATPFNLGEFSLETWVKLDRSHENQVFMNRGSAPQDFTFYLYDRIRFLVQDAGTYSHVNGLVPPADEWVHIVGTHAADGTKKLYYNGILQHETTVSPKPLTSNNPLYIGALEPGSRHLDGQMENMRIWGKALSEGEILQLLQTPPENEDINAMKSNGLIAYWASRSVDGQTIVDLTGNGNNGEFGAFEIDETNLAFKPDEGIVFDGFTNYAVLNEPLLFDIDTITVEAWVNVDIALHDRQVSNRGIVGRGNTSQYFSMFAGSQYGNRLHMALADTSDSAAPTPPAGQWVHVCGTFDMEVLTFYYNGNIVDSIDAFDIIPWGDDPLYVGSLSDTGGFFQGALDNIRVWDRALSQAEIIELLGTTPENENTAAMANNGLLLYYSSRAMSGDTLTDLSGNGYDAQFFGEEQPVQIERWSLY